MVDCGPSETELISKMKGSARVKLSFRPPVAGDSNAF